MIGSDENVRVVQLQVPGYAHLRAFDEVAASLVEGLHSLGIAAVHAHEVAPGVRNLLLGAHLLAPDALARLPEGTVVYNHEQVDPTSMLPPERLGHFSGLEVWDYSERNVHRWRAHDVDAAHVPIGWSPGLATLHRSDEPDIDVLFYGSLNERRQRILDALAKRSVRVHAAFGVYGAERDELIARSRLVINVQYYEARILEIVRLSYLFANGVPVVSERSSGMEVPAGFDDAAAFAGYDRLVSTTRALLDDPDALAALGQRGRERMEAVPWSRTLASVVANAHGAPSGAATETGAGPQRERPRGNGDPGRADTLVEFVCGTPGSALERARSAVPSTSPGQELVAQTVAALFDLAGTGPGALGPPPPLTPDIDPRLEGVRRRLLDGLARWRGPCPVSAPGLGQVLPFFLDACEEAGVACTVSVVIGDPVAAVGDGGATDQPAPIVTTLRWLSAAVFAEAYSRDVTRTLIVEPATGTVTPALGFKAMAMALELRDALAGAPPQLDRVDEIGAAYLDAMAWYFPLLADLGTPG